MSLKAKTGVKKSYAEFMQAYTWRAKRKNELKNWSPQTSLPVTIESALIKILSHPSTASKEQWVRQYDHEVKGATAVKPFDQGAPNDAGLIWMGAHSNSPADGFAGAGISAGLAPEASCFGGEIMATLACDEAIRNLVVMGCDPARIALCDNFSWPDPLPGATNPDAEEKLGLLVETNQGIAKVARAYEAPCISGKDSMKNDYVGAHADGSHVKISVLPTLVMTAMGYHPDVRRAIKPHARAGSVFCLVGAKTSTRYFGTTLMKMFALESVAQPEFFNLQMARTFYENFYRVTQQEIIESAHDLSEGGLLVALSESMFLREISASITVPHASHSPEALSLLFSEDPGRFLVSVQPKNLDQLKLLLGNENMIELGPITAGSERLLNLQFQDKATPISIHKANLAWTAFSKGGQS
jgi:phosphoribosylformylglycinamidine synthase